MSEGSLSVLIFAARGLTRRRLQTGLLLVALTVAIAGTMTIMAVLSGIEAQVARDLQQVGVDVVNVQVKPNLGNLLRAPLKMADTEWMQDQAPEALLAPLHVQMALGSADGAGEKSEILLLSTTSTWNEIVPLEMIEGQFFKAGEQEVCVLDEWVAERLFAPGAAVGRELVLHRLGKQRRLRVVGVMKDPLEIRKKMDEYDFTGSARATLHRVMEFKSVYVPGEFSDPQRAIHGAVMKLPPGVDDSLMKKRLRAEVRARDLPVLVWSRGEWVEGILRGANFMTGIASMIWVVVLLVTGVMILTISLVAIRERYREVAIRRTEGARRFQVVGQLLIENLLLSFTAGILAIGLARFVGAQLETRYLSWAPTFLPQEMALSVGLGVVIGALATLLPAYRAASLDPVKVLRFGN